LALQTRIGPADLIKTPPEVLEALYDALVRRERERERQSKKKRR